MEGCLLLACCFLFILTSVRGESCKVSENAAAKCSAVGLGDSERVEVVIIINVCHNPKDVLFTLKSPRRKWRWSHTFINTDETQPIRGPEVSARLRVRILRPDNQTLHVWANFEVDGEPYDIFFNHTFAVDYDIEQCISVPHDPSVKDFLVLLIFCSLCILIALTVTVFLLCLRTDRKCRHLASCCACACCPQSNQSLSSCKLLNSSASANSDRPLSCSSLQSSSHGSYEDPDENFFASRLRSAQARPNHRHPRKTKSMAITCRNSVYSDSIALEELPVISEGMPQFGSLGRNFRNNKKSGIGTIGAPPPHWIPTQVEDEYLSDLSLDSHGGSGQIPAHDVLHLEAGTSQPHYSATKFHSFRAKKKQKPANATTDNGGSGGGRRKQSPPPALPPFQNGRQPPTSLPFQDGRRQPEREDDLTPESPLLSPMKENGGLIGNGSLKRVVVEKNKNGGLKRRADDDRRLSAQHLLNAEMRQSDSFY